MFLLFASIIHIAAKRFGFVISEEDVLTLDPDHIISF